MRRTDSQRWEDEPWTLYTETKYQRDVLRRWVRRWERWSHQGVEASDGAFVPDTAVVPGSELRAASAGDPPPRAKR